MADKSRVKDKKGNGLVDPGNVYNYLKEKGVSHTHALGIMSNLNSESGWNPSAVGDSGNAIGLFQHNGPRKAALLKYVNGDTSNWKKQIDFALQESGSSTYLNKQFSNAESAGEYFMKNWERPKNQSDAAVSERLSWLKTWGGGKYADPNYVPTSSASISSADYDTTPGISTGLAQEFLVSNPQDYHRKAEEFKKELAVEKEKAKKVETDVATKELTAAQVEHNKRIEFLNVFNTPKEATTTTPPQEQAQEVGNTEDLYTQSLGFDLQDTSTPLFKTRLDAPQEFKDGGTQGDGLYTHSGHNYKKIDGKWYMEPKENSGEYKLIEKGDVKSRIAELEKNAQGYKNSTPEQVRESRRRVDNQSQSAQSFDLGYNQKASKKEDSVGENVFEFIDPTGISSWDDVGRAYDENGLFDPKTALEILGALPLVGKIGKSGKVLAGGEKLFIDAVKYFGYNDKVAKAYNAYRKVGGKNIDDALGLTTKGLVTAFPKLDPTKWASSENIINGLNKFTSAAKSTKLLPYTPSGDEDSRNIREYAEGGTQQLSSLLDIDKLGEFRGRYTQEFKDGGKVVSELWKEQTGLDWSEAKRAGKTDGSLEGNLKLKSELEASAPTISNQHPKAVTTDIQSAPDFNSAFKIARSTLGANKIFEYDGRQYGTNLSGETFSPSDEDIKASGLDLSKTKTRLQDENSRVTSIYSNKTTVKLQPNEYEDWNKIKERTTELNKGDNAQRIITYNKNRNLTNNYVIVDKKKGLMHIYDPKGNNLFSSAVDLGKNEGDAQTTTKYVDQNKDGKITNEDKVNGKFKVDWSAGNMSTGAGKFFISNIDAKGYEGLPILNMMNEAQHEKFKKTGKIENVSTSFHKGYIKDDETRVSNGCVRCNKTSLDNLTKYLQNSSEVYILPDDENNSFVYENGQLNFKTKSTNDYTKYRDSKGKIQQGQGINRGVNTLNYKPIKAELNKAKFQNEKFTAFDFNDEEEYKKVEEFTKALASSKRAVMKVAKINGDVYNELAKMTFGIFGTETNFADTHSMEGNIVRAIRKGVDRKSSSSPDYLEKYHLFGADEKTNSVGLTQIRWSYLNADEKAALKQVGITSNKDFMNPKKAAIGTTVVLGVRYNQQLTNKEKQDIWKNLPTKWNTRGNYADRVKSNSKYLSIKQKS